MTTPNLHLPKTVTAFTYFFRAKGIDPNRDRDGIGSWQPVTRFGVVTLFTEPSHPDFFDALVDAIVAGSNITRSTLDIERFNFIYAMERQL